jgi:hypothetical protein
VCLVAVEAADARARRALALASLIDPDEVRAVLVDVEPEATRRTVDEWDRARFGVELHVLPAPYRERAGPLRAEIQRLRGQGSDVVSLVLCTLRPRWWQRPLYLDDTGAIRRALAQSAGTALIEHGIHLPPQRNRDRGAPIVSSDSRGNELMR